jgi:ATP-dependent helicase/nuclease subunit A
VPEADLDALLPRARGLFEAVLTAQPGVTISTFHAWFLTVIERAPLEAGLAGFSLIEHTHLLEAEAWAALADDLSAAPDAPLALAMQHLLADIGLHNTRALMAGFFARRADWWAFCEGQDDAVAYSLAQLQAAMDVAPDSDIIATLLDDAVLIQALRDYADLLLRNSPTPEGRNASAGRQLHATLDERSATPACFDAICRTLLTDKGEPRSHKSGKTSIQRLGAADDARFLSLHAQLCERALHARSGLAAQRVYRFNADAFSVGNALLAHYQRLKHAARVLDFADVEWQVARLLADSDQAEYLQFKLDARYRHILLDEFQDTNPLQWRVLQSWFDAAASVERMPTIFLVGDPKQSIYRFRGAEAGLFSLARHYLVEHGAARLQQNTTRRSAPPVIEAVNRQFGRVAAAYPLFQPHVAHAVARAGRVEILPLAQPPELVQSAPDDCRNPLTTPYQDADTQVREIEAQQLVQRLQQAIGQWVIDDEKTGARAAEYRDVMILLRSRTHLAVYERALKAARIPYASTRSGGLLDTLEIGDLVSLLQFLVTPFNDLQLARALRSPLFDCSDAELLQLTTAPGDSLWQRLRELADQASPKLARAAALLRDWQSLAGRLPVHDLLDRIYFSAELPARYAAAAPDALRPGIAANLDAFIELALSLSGGRYPSLPRFLHELAELQAGGDASSPDLGNTTQLDNAVSIHTIHGAKGLEAPIVWLLDAGPHRARADSYAALTSWPPGAARPAHFSLYGDKSLRAEFQAPFFEAEARHAERENFNLLYVAMTRARQALIVSGAASKVKQDDWHGQLLAALSGQDDANEYSLGDALDAGATRKLSVTAPAAMAPLPLSLPALTPIGRRSNQTDSAQIQYGVLLHAILERIAPPAVMPGSALLRQQLGYPDAFDAALAHAQHLVSHPHLADFFDPSRYLSARNELPYLTATGETRRIDRVVQHTDALWILDYKSGDAGASDATLVQRHRAQLDEYRMALAQVYPGMVIRCGVIRGDGQLLEIMPALAPRQRLPILDSAG